MQLVQFYLLVGIATWFTHLSQCRSCRKVGVLSIISLFEGVFIIVCWPIEVIEFLERLFKKTPKIQVTGVISLTQREGESDEDFKVRTEKEVMRVVGDKIKERQNGK